jgi:hypothetical protein
VLLFVDDGNTEGKQSAAVLGGLKSRRRRLVAAESGMVSDWRASVGWMLLATGFTRMPANLQSLRQRDAFNAINFAARPFVPNIYTSTIVIYTDQTQWLLKFEVVQHVRPPSQFSILPSNHRRYTWSNIPRLHARWHEAHYCWIEQCYTRFPYRIRCRAHDH